MKKHETIIKNPAVYAMQILQKEMAGQAEKVGLRNEEDVQALVKEYRYEKQYSQMTELQGTEYKV